MLLKRTISQLDVGYVPRDQAEEMGRLGYLQWLWALRGDAGYAEEAARAQKMARPFIGSSPALAVFCDLLAASSASPFEPLEIKLPMRKRRGGSKARRDTRC